MNEYAKTLLEASYFRKNKIALTAIKEFFPNHKFEQLWPFLQPYFSIRGPFLCIKRHFIVTAISKTKYGPGFLFKRNFYSLKDYLIKDIILFDLKSKKTVDLLSRKYEYFSLFEENNKINTLLPDLAAYKIKPNFIPVSGILYYVQITNIKNLVVSVKLVHNLGTYSPEDLYLKDLLAQNNLVHTPWDDKFTLNNKVLAPLPTNNTPFITIDQDGAKDLDDAIGLEEDDKNYYLSVAIADLGGFLNDECLLLAKAKECLFSIYYLDKVIPMLPPSLSQDMGSLLKGTCKRVVISTLTIDKKTFTITKHVVKKAQINITANLYFSQCQTEPLVIKLIALAQKLKARYLQSISFYAPEISFYYRGDNLQYSMRLPNDNTNLIETLMVLTNIYMARFYLDNKIPAIYRVCPMPQMEKIKQFNVVMNANNYLPLDPSNLFASYQKVIKNYPQHLFYHDQLIKTQEKAYYTPTPTIHYPLGVKKYLHFTAPIRRYSDLINHCQLTRFLSKSPLYSTAELASICALINAKEKAINRFSTQANKLLGINYYQTTSEIVKGYINGFYNNKIDLLLTNSLYASMPLNAFSDYYIISPQRNMCYNLNHSKEYRVGELVTLQALNLSLAPMVFEFSIVDERNSKK